MVRLYYTGATTYLGVQPMPIKSLGGFISSSLLPNGSIGNLFGSISDKTVQDKLIEVKCIALKNETGKDVETLSFSYLYPEDCYSKLTISAIDPTKNETSTGCEQFFEKIPNQRSKPVYSQDFIEANVAFSEAKLEFITGASQLEIMTIMGSVLPPVTKTLSIEETYQFVADNFSNQNYTAEYVEKESAQVNSSGEEYPVFDRYLLLKTKTAGENNTQVTFETTGTVTVKELNYFSGGADNSVNIGPVKNNGYVGIWVIRELNIDIIKSQDCLPENEKQDKDNIQFIFDY